MLIPRSVFELYRSASDDPTRWQLNGVYLERRDALNVRAVATDGKQLTIAEWSDEQRGEFPGDPGVASAHEDFRAILRSWKTVDQRTVRLNARILLNALQTLLKVGNVKPKDRADVLLSLGQKGQPIRLELVPAEIEPSSLKVRSYVMPLQLK